MLKIIITIIYIIIEIFIKNRRTQGKQEEIRSIDLQNVQGSCVTLLLKSQAVQYRTVQYSNMCLQRAGMYV